MKNSFDRDAAKVRCKRYRTRILDVSQHVTALHIAPAFSCMEILDCIYNGLMRRAPAGEFSDIFMLSKGHGCMAQYAILEDIGVLPKSALDTYCTADGLLGAHPDLGVPGIAAATGSLGHGLGMSLGMALAERMRKVPAHEQNTVYAVLSDGEVQEGSTWEAVLLASSLGVSNLVAIIDNNDFQSLGRTSETHPSFYPLESKFKSFGWDVASIDGHDGLELYDAVLQRTGDKPLVVIAKTVKGKGVSYMENVPMWHYRAPNAEEYKKALAEVESSN
jgi:transketolase